MKTCEDCVYYSKDIANFAVGHCNAEPPKYEMAWGDWREPLVSRSRPCCRFFKEREKK